MIFVGYLLCREREIGSPAGDYQNNTKKFQYPDAVAITASTGVFLYTLVLPVL
jgi:hypothetical protein